MYSSIEGAKKRARSLSRMFEDSGIIYPLHKCQDAIARAGNFQNWFTLNQALKGGDRACDNDLFQTRLMQALPAPCRQSALAWAEHDGRVRYPEGDRPVFWLYDILPFVMSTAKAHRRSTSLIRIGSGTGQRLRESLVLGRLLNTHDHSIWPWLDPETLAMVYKGTLSDLFGPDFDHPHFKEAFEALIDAGVYDWAPARTETDAGTLRLLPPAGANLVEDVIDHHVSKIAQWFDEPEFRSAAVDTLREALASLGIANAVAIATAIVSQGAAGYITPSGPILDLLTELAAKGNLEALACAVALFAAIHPENAEFVRSFVPAKIAEHYLIRYRHMKADRLLAWGKRYPEWETKIIDALRTPLRFTATIEAIAEQIEAVAA